MENRYIKNTVAKQKTDDTLTYEYTRKNLYKALGLRKDAFQNKNILEIGPGHGYNAIVNMQYNPKYYHMVELNLESCNNIEELCKSNKIETSKYNVENVSLEEFSSEIKYDIVICEGTLAFLKNKDSLLKKISTFVEKDGILVLTAGDTISQFYELIRRLFANILVHQIDDKDTKIRLLVEAFESHTQTLHGFSKFIGDWCYDMFIDDDLYNNFLSTIDIVSILNDNFEFDKMTSPNLILDERWYRQISLDHKKNNEYKVNSFYKRWHNLFNYKSFSSERDIEKNVKLNNLCTELVLKIRVNENNEKDIYIKNIIDLIVQIKDNLKNIDSIIDNSLTEIITLLQKETILAKDISSMKYFGQCFGRGSQYLTLIKMD